MRNWVCAALVASVGCASTASLGDPKPLALKAGAREAWTFSMAGKQIGTHEAECKAVRTVGDGKALDWTYKLKMAVPVQGSTVNLSMNGTFTVTDRVAPLALTIEALVNGVAQRATYTVEGKTVLMDANAGGQTLSKTAALKGGEMLTVNNVIVLMSLAARYLNLAPGQSVKAALFSAEGMQPVTMDFKAAAKTETVSVGGKPTECVVCEVPTIAAKLYVTKATGDMVRYSMPAQQLEIVRQ